MSEPQIELQLERISRIAKHLPRNDLERFLLDLVENFLERENAYAQWVEKLNSQSKSNV